MPRGPKLTNWLPTTRKELDMRGWDDVDVIIFSGDAYVDHPAFGAAVIGRVIEATGMRVGIVPQPDWHGDFRDFKRLGRPRLFFAIAPGCMDSMVNKYTAARRLRSEDAYSPDGRHDKRPEYPTIVYSRILRQLYPETPIVLGGIEASMRRLAHYDYWQEKTLPCVLVPSDADLITYGMGEKVTEQLINNLRWPMILFDRKLHYEAEDERPYMSREVFREATRGKNTIPQTVALYDKMPKTERGDVVLHSYEDCVADPRKQAENFKFIEVESNRMHAKRIIQRTGERFAVVNPPYPPLTTEELDRIYDLPFTRLPHPKYKGKRIPAYEMIRHSVTTHRGCFGGCAFCTISAHQGKFVTSRSRASILQEVRRITEMPDFKGYISDLGGPSANMYMMGGEDKRQCEKCKRPSCLHPKICSNLNSSHEPLLKLYWAVDRMPGVKKCFVSSGVRYDLMMRRPYLIRTYGKEYARELITKHVSGRLKVAPEHTAQHVLDVMRKPSLEVFRKFKEFFDMTCAEAGLNQQLIPYFISSHPGCTEEDMAELALLTKEMDFHLEQVQDFTPTPMTLATEMWATGLNPYTMERVYSAHSQEEKQKQRMFFFWYKPEERQRIMQELRRMGREDLIGPLLMEGKRKH